MTFVSPTLPKTTPILIGDPSNQNKGSAITSISRNSSKMQHLRNSFWPSSLPSSDVTSSINKQSDEISDSPSTSINFLSGLFNNFRSGSNVSAPSNQDKKVYKHIANYISLNYVVKIS